MISKDSDFYNSYLTNIEPYKLILISTGNTSTKELLILFDKNLEKIMEEIASHFVVEVTKTSLITIV